MQTQSRHQQPESELRKCAGMVAQVSVSAGHSAAHVYCIHGSRFSNHLTFLFLVFEARAGRLGKSHDIKVTNDTKVFVGLIIVDIKPTKGSS